MHSLASTWRSPAMTMARRSTRARRRGSDQRGLRMSRLKRQEVEGVEGRRSPTRRRAACTSRAPQHVPRAWVAPLGRPCYPDQASREGLWPRQPAEDRQRWQDDVAPSPGATIGLIGPPEMRLEPEDLYDFPSFIPARYRQSRHCVVRRARQGACPGAAARFS